MSWLLMTQRAKEGRRGSNAREQFDRYFSIIQIVSNICDRYFCMIQIVLFYDTDCIQHMQHKANN